MRMSWRQIPVLSLLAAAALSFTAMSQGAKPPAEPTCKDDWGEPAWRQPGQCMSKEAIDNMLERIKETDPAAAERLSKLRDEPEKLLEEFGRYAREHRKDMRGGDRPQGKWWTPEQDKGGWGREIGKGGGYRWREQMWQRHQDFMKWFAENYPQDANELEAIRETNPPLYTRKLMQYGRKYGKIAEAARENPELAEVMKENVALKDKRDEVLKKLRTAKGDEKEALTKELNTIVAKRFDLIVKRKQLQHEQLLKKLEKLKEQVKESEAEVEKWKGSKDQKVKERVDELLGKAEEFHWD